MKIAIRLQIEAGDGGPCDQEMSPVFANVARLNAHGLARLSPTSHQPAPERAHRVSPIHLGSFALQCAAPWRTTGTDPPARSGLWPLTPARQVHRSGPPPAARRRRGAGGRKPGRRACAGVDRPVAPRRSSRLERLGARESEGEGSPSALVVLSVRVLAYCLAGTVAMLRSPGRFFLLALVLERGGALELERVLLRSGQQETLLKADRVDVDAEARLREAEQHHGHAQPAHRPPRPCSRRAVPGRIARASAAAIEAADRPRSARTSASRHPRAASRGQRRIAFLPFPSRRSPTNTVLLCLWKNLPGLHGP